MAGVAGSRQLGGAPADICSLVLRHAELEPRRLFCQIVMDGDEKAITYGELVDAARCYASAYRRHGVQSGDVVLIILRHGPELFASFLGAMLIGALPSFLPFLTSKQNPELYWTSHATVFARTGARLLVTWKDNLQSLRAALPDVSIAIHLKEDTLPTPEPLEQREYQGSAFLQHSSGTTGLKKGVVITHEALCAQTRAYAKAIGLGAEDRIATWLPLYHDMGLVSCFLMPLMLGVPVVALDPFEWVARPAMLFDAIERYRCTLVWLPNFAFHHLCTAVSREARWNLQSVRALIDCSEPCKAESLELFAARFGGMGLDLSKIQTCYALAENVFAATQSTLGEPPRTICANRYVLQSEHRIELTQRDGMRFVSCGRAIEGVQVRIRDETDGNLPDGQVGEIVLGGACVFDGYYRNSAETEARLADGWYRTRDLGFLLDGELYVTGRLDDLLIVHGVNYYAHDVEFAANRVPGVIGGRCVAIGDYQPGTGTSEVVLLAEVQAGTEERHAEIRRAIKIGILAETGLLVQQAGLVPAGWLVKTSSGKISRSENLKRFRQQKHKAAKP
jgi:fatty-acyl-CoA synthase